MKYLLQVFLVGFSSFLSFTDWGNPTILVYKINEEKQIANEFNNFFIDVGLELPKEIPGPAIPFESYDPNSKATVPTGLISVTEF